MHKVGTVTAFPKRTLSMSPTRFLLWLCLISITMFFAALTSAYLVKRAQGDWIHFNIPVFFAYTTVCIAASSLTMQLAYVYAKRNAMWQLRGLLWFTLCLGVVFLWGQYVGWQELTQDGVYLVGHPAGSFIYILSGAHAVHIAGGLLYLSVLIVQALRHKVHSESMRLIEMCATYWHFIGILWIYLYAFMLLNQ